MAGRRSIVCGDDMGPSAVMEWGSLPGRCAEGRRCCMGQTRPCCDSRLVLDGTCPRALQEPAVLGLGSFCGS
jgi:hypothetical protein